MECVTDNQNHQPPKTLIPTKTWKHMGLLSFEEHLEVNPIKINIMPSPTTAVSPSASTYTTIPISGADVISRSFQNISNFISRRRPWPEFIASAGIFDRPDSLSAAGIRLRRNANYFTINYAFVISASAAFSLIGSPISLILIASIVTLWLVLHFFREDPMVVWSHHVSDRIVIVGLVLISVGAVWFTGILNNLLIGIAIGVLICAIHGIFRNPEGLFLDENDAVYNGLIGSPPSSSFLRSHFPS